MHKQRIFLRKTLVFFIIICFILSSSIAFAITKEKINHSPDKPDKPSGPPNGKAGETLIFTAVTNDSDNDKIAYLFDWGDGTTSGWTEFYPSGEIATASHSWEKGTYIIRVKAKDTFSAESDWSDPLVSNKINSFTKKTLKNKSLIAISYILHDPIYIHGNKDFTIENGVTGGSGTYDDPFIIKDWEIDASSKDGITIKNVSVFFEIRNCYIHNGGLFKDGIVFYNVTNGAIINNIITDNRNGTVFRTQGFGLKENSCNNKITKNNISNNRYDGIHFQHTTFGHHSYNHIFLNNITRNKRGIFLIMSHENLIYSNNIISNSKFGVELFICTGGGINNTVFHNNFIDNGDENGQAFIFGTQNNWDDGYPSGGNYWSDYVGEDKKSGPYQNNPGGDGIGDEPYVIPGSYGYDDYDFYPIIDPYGWINYAPYNITIEGPVSGKMGQLYTFNASADDPEGRGLYYFFDWGDNTNSSWVGPYFYGNDASESHSWRRGVYEIKVKAKDTRGYESNWSEPLTVTIPRNGRSIDSFPFLKINGFRIFEKFFQIRNLILVRILHHVF
jgi:parallel beta-helix repeat protein